MVRVRQACDPCGAQLIGVLSLLCNRVGLCSCGERARVAAVAGLCVGSRLRVTSFT